MVIAIVTQKYLQPCRLFIDLIEAAEYSRSFKRMNAVGQKLRLGAAVFLFQISKQSSIIII
jgi:hypothetical protein